MPEERVSLMEPPIEELLDKVDSKFTLVTLSARRGRQINSYFNQLGEGLGSIVPPQVSSNSRKPLTIALEEIAAGKIATKQIATSSDDGNETSESEDVRAPDASGASDSSDNSGDSSDTIGGAAIVETSSGADASSKASDGVVDAEPTIIGDDTKE